MRGKVFLNYLSQNFVSLNIIFFLQPTAQLIWSEIEI